MLIESIFESNDKNQSVKIFIPKHHKNIVVNVSGGTDSSLSLYLVCLYIQQQNRTKDIEVTVRHGIDRYRVPYSYDNCVKYIFDEFQKHFPDINFKLYTFPFVEVPNKGKRWFMGKDKDELIKQGYQCFFDSCTSNPSEMTQKQNGMWETKGRQTKRELDEFGNLLRDRTLFKFFDEKSQLTEDIENCHHANLRPFLKVNKAFIADWYFKTPFLKDIIFPLTNSCVSSDPIITKSWTQPCKECWWCKEKKWAFGKFDYERLE